ncbi:MAG: hypothetical protein KDB32_01335 [Planctomycetes bacterium]|nr:hypothetical protein [Planctomycetota bacterium]
MSSSELEDIIEDGPEPDPTPEDADTAPDADASEPAVDVEAPPKKRVKPLRLKAAVVLPLLFGVSSLAYFFMIDGILADQLVVQAQSYAGEHGQAEVGNVSFSIFGPKLRIENLRAWQDLPEGEHEVAYLGRAELDIEFWPLLERRLVVNDISATEIRLQEPWKPESEQQADDVPTDTNQPELNDYLKKLKDVLESEELKDLRDWLEKLKEYQDKQDEPPTEPEGQVEGAPPEEFGPSSRAWYVEEALSREEAKPQVVVKHASLDELAVSWGSEDEVKFAHKVTNLELSAESVTSDPIAYKLPMKFKAAGNLNGDADRRVELGLTVRFDPDELIKLEQVDGAASIKSLDISSLVDTSVFGKTLTGASLTVTRFASEHSEFSGRTRLNLTGAIQPPGFAMPAKASFAIWFGGYRGDTAAAAFMPSGVSVQVEDFPLQQVLKLAGESPIPLKDNNATISFGTCDANGNYATPESALSWHDGIKVHMRLQVKGLEFADPQGDLGGLPGTFMVRGLNKVISGMGGLDLIVGFEGSKDRIGLDLEKPGLRAFVDAIVNALTLNAPEIKSLIDLPFDVSGNSSFGLASVNADGTQRDPQLSVSGEARHNLNDLRVAFNLRDINITPKPGQSTIIGLPAPDFCRAFNAFMGTLGPDGLSVRTRLMNAEGNFSPALESPGVRGVVDAMAGVLSYSGQQINSQFDLPLVVSPNTDIKCESVDAQGKARTLSSPGADSDSLGDLRLRLRASNFTVSPKPGQSTILGIPAKEFCTSFNTFIQAQGQQGLALDWKLLDETGNFAPQMKQPGTRGLLDGVVNALKYNGSQLNSNFNLPFKLADNATVSPSSIEPNGKVRTLSGPQSGSNDLNSLTIAVVLKDGYAEKKPGVNTIFGIPADYFLFAWNKLQASFGQNGMGMRLRLFNDKGEYAPALTAPTEEDLVKMVGNTVGIGNFKTEFAKLGERFKQEFPAFQKEGLKVAKDIAEGKFKAPEVPKLPDTNIPKLPWD